MYYYWFLKSYSGVRKTDKGPYNLKRNFLSFIFPAEITLLFIPSVVIQTCTLTFMVTFPFVIFLILKPTVGIISSVNCPD